MSIRELRNQKNLSQEAVARAACLSLRQFSRIESVAAPKMTFDTFVALAGAFQVDFNTLGAIIKSRGKVA